MKLYIRQKIFALGDKYDVSDEFQNPVYQVHSELLTIGAKIHLEYPAGRELYYIRQRVTLFLGRYEIHRNGEMCATIQQELAFFKPRLTMESSWGDFEITGNVFSMDFEIRKEGVLVGSVHKQWMAWSDTYELYVPEGQDGAFFAAVVIAIDHCIHNGNKR
ncbi:LURP-one-related family protein [Anaerotalea alkaliphila]|uniref:LURP-one-related family protein n=1 Tax=Anaerotalea alkaliphila TaxID=2662126 RepID=A0A7X5HY54_9FIRM|nr:hypothetical protein [Anaerotalea alkaliphila]